MTMTTIEFEVDTELWEAFRKICEENGVTPEEALRRLVEEFVMLGGFPFEPDPEILEEFPKLKEHFERKRRREAEGKE